MNQEHRATTVPSRRWPTLPAIALGAAGLLSGCFGGHHQAKTTPAVLPKTAPVAGVPAVVRRAPDFAWIGAGGKATPLKALHGQPVVLIIAASPDEHMFRKQVDRIDHLYLELSARKAVFLAAFSAQPGRVLSNVPYALAQNGGAVAAAYGVPANGFAVIVISPDGNIDFFSNGVEAAQRLLDMINNSYQTQAASRTGLGS